MTGLHQSDQNELKNKSKWKETIKQTCNRVRYSATNTFFRNLSPYSYIYEDDVVWLFMFRDGKT